MRRNPHDSREKVIIRVAKIEDADSIADVYLRSRKELVSCAPLVHSDDDVRHWVRSRLIPAGRTTIVVAGERVVAFIACSSKDKVSWIDHLYVLPECIGSGSGSRLLELAQRELTPPIRLYTFQCNARARRFYERRGFRPIVFGDGSGNEENCPDILYEWAPAQ